MTPAASLLVLLLLVLVPVAWAWHRIERAREMVEREAEWHEATASGLAAAEDRRAMLDALFARSAALVIADAERITREAARHG